MPELPEVETIKRDLARHICGLSIEDIRILDRRVVRHVRVEDFCSRIKGKTVAAVERRAKAIVITFKKGGMLIIQPMMTGQVVFVAPQKSLPADSTTKVIFRLSKGNHILYNDQRLFGRLQVVNALDEVSYIRTLGPDPLESVLDEARIQQYVFRRTMPVKPLLLDQRFIAGIGNIYASEILFAAGIAPDKKACHLESAHIKRLCRAVKQIIHRAVKLRGTSMRNYRDGFGEKGNFKEFIKVYARAGEPCLKCRSVIKKIVQAGRSTFFCPSCQKN